MPPSGGYLLPNTTCSGSSSGAELIHAEALRLFGADALRGATPPTGTSVDPAEAKAAAED